MNKTAGMDTDLVRAVAAKLDTQAQSLQNVIGTIDSLISQAINVWQGRDAHDFLGWWQNQHKPALSSAHGSLAGLAQSARNNATDQDGASGVGLGPSGGPGVAVLAGSIGAAGSCGGGRRRRSIARRRFRGIFGLGRSASHFYSAIAAAAEEKLSKFIRAPCRPAGISPVNAWFQRNVGSNLLAGR